MRPRIDDQVAKPKTESNHNGARRTTTSDPDSETHTRVSREKRVELTRSWAERADTGHLAPATSDPG
jgi:hypothetical protein